VLLEFLPLFVGQAIVDDVLQNGRRFYTVGSGQAFVPGEFQGACYRFGHSMVRPSYRANLKGDSGNPFFGFIFGPSQNGAASDPSDFRGGFRAPRRFVGWQTFFDFGDGQVKRNKRVDTRLSTPLFTLPLGAIATHDQPTVLPQRNLLRQLTWSMPSGQSIAAVMGVPALSKQQLSELKPYGFDTSTPLWYYALKEAEVIEQGLHPRRGVDRALADRPEQLPDGESELAADLRLLGVVPDDGLSHLCRRRPHEPPRPAAPVRLAGTDPESRT
jgi:hypothetical protein